MGKLPLWTLPLGTLKLGTLTLGTLTLGTLTLWTLPLGNINAGNINAWDIKAGNINAGNISYHAFCCVYNSIKCTSVKARREKHQEPICLGGKLEFKQEQTIIELTLEQIAEKFGKRVEDIKIKK